MIYDITPSLSSSISVYPGDRPLGVTKVGTIEKDGFNLSEIRGTVHLGAHVDSPYHYFEEGKKVDQLDLNILIGRCQLIRPQVNKGECIYPNSLVNLEENIVRLLICSEPDRNYNKWDPEYHPISLELADFLLQKNIKLLGIDAPSVDSSSEGDGLIHKKLLSHEVILLESLYLKEVPAGVYELIALPLKITGAEAAPVRVILRSI